MTLAFVLINPEIGSEDVVLKELKALEQVKETYLVYGAYDIVAKVEADTMDELKTTISSKIRPLNGINATLTLIVIE